MNETPQFIQGVFGFRGAGLTKPAALEPPARHKVPFDKRAQLIYLRAGNPTDELVCLTLMRGKQPMRLFPIGAKGSLHVQLAIVEDIDPESELELCIQAPEGLQGSLVVDMGLMEI
ncbi:MAG TPA: molybdopterin oxidoreductase [Polyangiaceae bacterium]|nr:molybdopterin oxidoreductase [Polyangiaceae bacterium]